MSEIGTIHQETPRGSGEKRGEENLTKDTPPKKGFGPPPRAVCFPPPGRRCSVSPVQNPQLSRPEALLEGPRNFREGALRYCFPPPRRFAHPPYHDPNLANWRLNPRNSAFSGPSLVNFGSMSACCKWYILSPCVNLPNGTYITRLRGGRCLREGGGS